MKLAVFLCALALSTPVFSWGYGGAQGKNRLGQTIHFSESAEPRPGFAVSYDIWISTLAKDEESVEKFNMETECPALIDWLDITSPKENEKPIIYCRADGKSPLAGATYKKIRSNKIMNSCGNPATVFECIKGCKAKSVPHLIVESPWEC